MPEMALPLHRLHVIGILGAVAPLLGLALAAPMPWYWLPLAAAIGVTGAGTVFLLRPHLLHWNRAAWLSHGSLPMLLVFAATLSLRSFRLEPPWLMVLGWLLTLLVLGALLLGKYHALSNPEVLAGPIGESLNLASYLTAFLFFVALYRFQPSLPLKLGVVAIVGWLLALELLGHTPAPPARRLIFAAVVSISLAEAALSLHFWPQEGAFTAVFLLVGFYLITGILQIYLRQRLNPWVAVEFTGVGMVSFMFLYAFQTWRIG